MLITVLADAGQALAPHELWAAWNVLPLPVLVLVAWAYRRGTTGRALPSNRWRSSCFLGGLVATGLALITPLDALAAALASAHMVQHLLLVLVAAPLLALSAPSAIVLRGVPRPVRRLVEPWQRRQRPLRKRLASLDRPVALWLLHVGTLWFWHASTPYEAALAISPLHVLEHVSFVATGFLFWRVTIGPRRQRHASNGFAVLLVFCMALQSVFLSALLTFASEPWYGAYAPTTRRWGLDPLTDQQLAGLIMWVPGGLLYVAAALGLLVGWIRSSERELQDSSGGLVAFE